MMISGILDAVRNYWIYIHMGLSGFEPESSTPEAERMNQSTPQALVRMFKAFKSI